MIKNDFEIVFLVHHQARSKKRKNHSNLGADHETSSSSDDLDDDLEDPDLDEEDEEQFDSFQDPCPEFEQDRKSPDSQYIPPPADTSWTSPTSSNDSGIASCDPLLSTLTNSNKFEQVQSSSILTSSTTTTTTTMQQQINNKVANLNNNNDDIMKEFTDFVDLVDSLQGMPDIDFEDNFEMFPIQ